MSKRSKYTEKEKFKILQEYNNGGKTIKEIASFYKINISTFTNWRYKYEKYGIDGLKESRAIKFYSEKMKENAVKDYLSGQFSRKEVARMHEVSNASVLQKWVDKYNKNIKIEATAKGRNDSMKRRSTTWEERIDIVLFCISLNCDYYKTAEVHNVSYQQVNKWVRKYKSGGVDALKDGRGRNKSEDELTPEEKMKFEMKKLKADNERLKAENAFLKKLEELERGRF